MLFFYTAGRGIMKGIRNINIQEVNAMRKLTTVTVLILALAMCFALSACGAPSEPPEPSEEVVQTPSPAPSEEVAQTPSPAPSEEPAQTPSAPAENNAKPQMLKLNIGSASSVSVLHRSGNTVYITDEAVIRRITDNFNTPSFLRGGSDSKCRCMGILA